MSVMTVLPLLDSSPRSHAPLRQHHGHIGFGHLVLLLTSTRWLMQLLDSAWVTVPMPRRRSLPGCSSRAGPARAPGWSVAAGHDAAVDVPDRAGHPAGGRGEQEGDGVGQVTGGADPAQRVEAVEAV